MDHTRQFYKTRINRIKKLRNYVPIYNLKLNLKYFYLTILTFEVMSLIAVLLGNGFVKIPMVIGVIVTIIIKIYSESIRDSLSKYSICKKPVFKDDIVIDQDNDEYKVLSVDNKKSYFKIETGENILFKKLNSQFFVKTKVYSTKEFRQKQLVELENTLNNNLIIKINKSIHNLLEKTNLDTYIIILFLCSFLFVTLKINPILVLVVAIYSSIFMWFIGAGIEELIIEKFNHKKISIAYQNDEVVLENKEKFKIKELSETYAILVNKDKEIVIPYKKLL